MGFFDDNDFDEIMRQFLESSGRSNVEQEDEYITDVIEDREKVYIIFELPGYSEKDIEVSITKNRLRIIAQKKNFEGAKEYLSKKLSKGIRFEKIIPKVIDTDSMKFTFRNGILEISFHKVDFDKIH